MTNSMGNERKNEGPLFKDLQADDPDPEATEIESLCVECEEMVNNVYLFTDDLLPYNATSYHKSYHWVTKTIIIGTIDV